MSSEVTGMGYAGQVGMKQPDSLKKQFLDAISRNLKKNEEMEYIIEILDKHPRLEEILQSTMISQGLRGIVGGF